MSIYTLALKRTGLALGWSFHGKLWGYLVSEQGFVSRWIWSDLFQWSWCLMFPLLASATHSEQMGHVSSPLKTEGKMQSSLFVCFSALFSSSSIFLFSTSRVDASLFWPEIINKIQMHGNMWNCSLLKYDILISFTEEFFACAWLDEIFS